MTTTPIIPQPVHLAWLDARHAAADLARQHGYAVLVYAEGGSDSVGGPYRAIPGKDLEECEDLAGDMTLLAEFNLNGEQAT